MSINWLIEVDGERLESKDFTVGDLIAAEEACGVGWGRQNPLMSAKVARAWLAVTLYRAGRTDSQVEQALAKVTFADLESCFTFVPDKEPDPGPLDRPRPRGKGSKGRGSSRGASATGSPPPSPEPSD